MNPCICIYLIKTSISTYFSSTTGGGGGEGGGVGCFTGSSTGFSISFLLCLLTGFLSNVFLVILVLVLGDGGFSGSLGVRTSGVGGGCVGVLTSPMSSSSLASTSSGTYN